MERLRGFQNQPQAIEDKRFMGKSGINRSGPHSGHAWLSCPLLGLQSVRIALPFAFVLSDERG
jgi:hypothetical protein